MNPLLGNPLRQRADLQAAMLALSVPVLARLSPGGARAPLGASAAVFDSVAAELEGFARPLWGLAPLAAGGGAGVPWHRFRQGLAAGTDPEHPEFWGEVGDLDQRMVEMAAIGFALALVPDELWDPLSPAQRDRLVAWLNLANRRRPVDNNWLFFRVLVNLGLAAVDAGPDRALMREALDRLESFHLGGGWYADGPTAQRDYYVPWAMHFYSLVYARLAGDRDPDRAQRMRERAAGFATDFARWFAADGAALPFGRSLTYRFAQAAFWGALAFADVEALPWGVVKGLALRHLRWWRERPIFTGDGLLSVGYAYPNLNLAEQYNSPGSPYWAAKLFLPLALPAEHPFWLAAEQPLPEQPPVAAQPHAGMVLLGDREGRHVTALSGSQHALWARHGAEKYAKFAYSTAFGFSVPSGRYGLQQAAADSMLALSLDGVHFHVREQPVDSTVSGDTVRSRWRPPLPGVTVETWLIARPPWHLRVHRLSTEHRLHSAEGGFAIDRTGLDPVGGATARTWQATGLAAVRCPAGGSGLRDLDGQRDGQVILTDPNTNVLAARTALPTLLGVHEPGEHWLTCAVLADPDPQEWAAAWESPPQPPSRQAAGDPMSQPGDCR